MKTSRTQVRAFTLLEMLAVIVLVLVLMAFLLPVIRRGGEKTQTIKCMANLRQIGAGIFLYAGEHNGRLPEAYYFGLATSSPIISHLEPYVGNGTEIWDCPSNPKLRAAGFTGYVQGNYAPAFYFGHLQTGKEPYTLLQVQEFPDPAKRWLLEDMDGWNYGNPSVAQAAPNPVHQNGRNVLFVDGHVEWRPSKKNVLP